MKNAKSLTAKKGMWVDGEVTRFNAPGTAFEPGRGKSWFRGSVVRTQYDGKGEVIRRDKQTATVFAREDEVAGYLSARCPDPFIGMDASESKTKVFYEALGSEDKLL